MATSTPSKRNAAIFADTITVSGDTVIGGDLTVSGTTTTINTETINLADNIIVLNSNASGAATENAGIEIERGTDTNVSLIWDETNNRWTVGSSNFVAGTFIGALSGNASTASSAAKWTTARTLSLTGAVTGSVSIDGSGNVSLATTATSDPTLTLSGDVTGSATFTNLGNATLTATVANDSHTHDGRYYTESESDSRFFNVSGDTVTGDAYFNATTFWRVSASDAANQRADARDDSTNASRLHWYGMTDTGGTSNFRHAWYDGSNYINVTASAPGRIDFTGSAASMYIGSGRVFTDGYHPNADKWTTARTNTVTLTGSVTGTGSASVDGSGNWTVTIPTTTNHTHNYDNYGSWTAKDHDGTTYTVTSGDTLWFKEGGAIDVNFTADDELTISHADTSSQGSVNNSNGTVIQDVTLDGYGHVTGLASVDLDGRYARRYEGTATIDANTYVTVATLVGDRLGSGCLLHVNGTSNGVVVNVVAEILVNHSQDIIVKSVSGNYTQLYIQIVSDANEDFAINLKRTGETVNTTPVSLDIYPYNDEAVTFTGTNPYSGTTHEHLTKAGTFTSASDGNAARIYTEDDFYVGSNRVFHDGYHPNADKWTTARTLSLTGGVTGSVSWDGSANASIVTTVNDGSGSGLDADLLDGIQAASFLRSDTSGTFNGTLTVGGTSVSGGEGGEIRLTHAPTTSLAGASVVIDMQTNSLRIFEDASPFKGAYIDLTTCGSQSKIWHEGNDGSGSGLNADLLDGNHASAFHTAGNPVFSGDAATKDDITTRTETGFYQTSSATIAEGWPATTNNWHHLIACTHSNDVNYYSMQLSSSFNDQNLFFRSTNGSGTTAWSKIWNSSNHGSGSGLDADTLDGVQGSAFVYDKGTAPTDLNTAGMGVWRMNTGHTPQPAGTAYGTLVSFDNVNDTGFQLASDYSGLTFYWRSSNAPVYGGVGSFSEWNKISTVRSTTTATSKTLTSGEHCTVTAAGQTITLPANPSAGMEVFISVGNFTNTIVGRNGQNIMGVAENMTIDTAYVGLTFTFSGDATQGWRIS